MQKRDYSHLLSEAASAYAEYAPKSAALHQRAMDYLVDGGSHAIRLMEPFPPRIVEARGAWVLDLDGHRILDFWQGHLGNLLGHNPEFLTEVLARVFGGGVGLQTGLVDPLQVETAEILCRQTGSERVRFTTSGSLATMYAILLSRAYTGREMVFKVGGGWHGAQPWGLKGVEFGSGLGNAFQRVESAGIPLAVSDQVLVSCFNDPEMLADLFGQYGDRVACLIVEPMVGAGGLIPASRVYLETARRLAHEYGAILILDEVISGFRFRAGNMGWFYGIQPDLATFGKIIGGGMPVAAVAGRADILALAGRDAGSPVKFSGGTFSAHPAALLAAKTMMIHLVENQDWIYPRLAELGRQMRHTVESAFAQEGLVARCTGHGTDVLPGSSMTMVHFPYRADVTLDKPDVVFDPLICDVSLSQSVLPRLLLLENVHMIHAHGAISTAHSEADIVFLGEACRRAARRIAMNTLGPWPAARSAGRLTGLM